MVDVAGKSVAECGWAASLLWICTDDGYAIQLYDAPIKLNDRNLEAGEDMNSVLARHTIERIVAGRDAFTVILASGDTLSVGRADVETARIFKRADTSSHVVYSHGILVPDSEVLEPGPGDV